MKIVYASDLHLEFNGWDKTCRHTRNWEPGDVLVLVGDTIPAPSLMSHRNDVGARKRQAAMKRAMDQLSPLYRRILMVGGNHEHYGMVYSETYPTMKEFLKDWENISYLENELFELDGVRFICATLWTSMKNRDPLVMETCRRGMNDYNLIYEDGLTRKPITPDFTVDRHYESLNFIQATAVGNDPNDISLDRFNQQKPVGPTVVVTHHPPTSWGLNPQYRQQGGNLLNYAFYSDLEAVIPETVRAWLHGHTHHTYDFKIGNTLILANQLGYYMEQAHHLFRPDRWIEISDDGNIIPKRKGKK